MDPAITTTAESPRSEVHSREGCWTCLKKAEDLVVVACLAAMVIVPLTEASLRRLFNTGIPAAASIVQHLCLVLAMLGGAIAARDERLLALSTFTSFLPGRLQSSARILSHSFGAAISTVLGFAAFQFVLQEKAAGNTIVYGLPRWTVEAVMPLGFALIGLRLCWNSSRSYAGRAAALMLCSGLLLLAARPPVPPDKLVPVAIPLLLLATFLGTPIFVVLGGAAAILFWGNSMPLAGLPIDQYGLVMNGTLPTIPLFTLTGYFLAESGAAKRLLRVCQAYVGHIPGGAAIATTLACAFFTCFTGASGVTILALGGLLLPILTSAGYSERNSLGMITGAGSLGMLFPPCLPLILYAIISNVEMKQMFLGGIIPGFVLIILSAALGIWQCPRQSIARGSFSLSGAACATWEAKWELAIPLVALVSMFGGFCSPLEAAALTALYAFFVEVFIYRDLKIGRDAPRVMTECALLVGGVMLILGVALGFTDYLIESEAADQLLAWVQKSIHEPWIFLLVLNLFLLVVGCLMDVFSAIIVVAPLILPLGQAFGIHPVHLGIIFLANLELGFLTPPVGMNLFLSSYRFGRPVSVVTRATLPMLLVLLLGVLLITYIPWLTTFLPRLVR